MGHKVNPTSFRIPTIYTWRSQWYADKDYAKLLREDRAIRNFLSDLLGEAGISRVEIERNISQLTVSIHTAKPGIVIGRGGQKVDELRTDLEKLTGRRVRVNIQEIRTPRTRRLPRRAQRRRPTGASRRLPPRHQTSRPAHPPTRRGRRQDSHQRPPRRRRNVAQRRRNGRARAPAHHPR